MMCINFNAHIVHYFFMILEQTVYKIYMILCPVQLVSKKNIIAGF